MGTRASISTRLDLRIWADAPLPLMTAGSWSQLCDVERFRGEPPRAVGEIEAGGEVGGGDVGFVDGTALDCGWACGWFWGCGWA